MLRLLIGEVDVDGFTGRDFHPEPTDKGKIVEVLSMNTEGSWGPGPFDSVSINKMDDPSSRVSQLDALRVCLHNSDKGIEGYEGYQWYLCWEPESRRYLEIVEFEVESFVV